MKKGDVVVILLVVTLSIASLVLINSLNKSIDKKSAVVEVNGEVVKEILINKNTKETYEFNFADNVGYVEVKDGNIRMLKMDKDICPQQICSETGWIEYKYETIICLPNKISINIQGVEDRNNEVDGVSF